MPRRLYHYMTALYRQWHIRIGFLIHALVPSEALLHSFRTSRMRISVSSQLGNYADLLLSAIAKLIFVRPTLRVFLVQSIPTSSFLFFILLNTHYNDLSAIDLSAYSCMYPAVDQEANVHYISNVLVQGPQTCIVVVNIKSNV